MRQKFKSGDRVKIADELPIWKRHFIKGREAYVLYTYDDLYGGGDNDSYALLIDMGGRYSYSAWYNTPDLTLVKKCKQPNPPKNGMKWILVSKR